MLDQHARQAETIRRLETALEMALADPAPLPPTPMTRTPMHAIRRERYTKPCPMRCGNLCDRDAKRCGSCWSGGIREPLRVEPIPLTVVPPLAQPRPIPNIVRAGTCLDDDHCPRWFCRHCNTYWLGDSSAHDCAAVRDSA